MPAYTTKIWELELPKQEVFLHPFCVVCAARLGAKNPEDVAVQMVCEGKYCASKNRFELALERLNDVRSLRSTYLERYGPIHRLTLLVSEEFELAKKELKDAAFERGNPPGGQSDPSPTDTQTGPATSPQGGW